MKPVDIIMIMMTVAICLFLMSPLIYSLAFGVEITDTKAKLISGVVVTIISMISAYVVTEIKKKP